MLTKVRSGPSTCPIATSTSHPPIPSGAGTPGALDAGVIVGLSAGADDSRPAISGTDAAACQSAMPGRHTRTFPGLAVLARIGTSAASDTGPRVSWPSA